MALHATLLLASAFHAPGRVAQQQTTVRSVITRMQARDPFVMPIDLGASGKGQLKFKPSFASSEAVLVKYALPFELSVEQQSGKPVVTKDGPGGERVGDVLRYSTKWEQELPNARNDGVFDMLGSFGGLLKWKVNMFDMNKAQSWDDVVEALTSNTPDRTDSVTLVFERPGGD